MSAIVPASSTVMATVEEAREITDRINTAIDVTWELIVEAYQRRAWAALGYRSWDEYTDAEFRSSRLRLPREERREMVASLRDAGLSLRAIGAAVGVSVGTVHGDLAGVQDRTPASGDVIDVEVVEEPDPIEVEPGPEPEPEPKPVTGKDGKTYRPRQRPKPVEQSTNGSVVYTPDSRPPGRGKTKTYRELIDVLIASEDGRWAVLAESYPPNLVRGVAIDDAEFQKWVRILERSRSQLSSYINALRRQP